MGNKVMVLLLMFSVVKECFACWILDPTYDFAFKALFGEGGPATTVDGQIVTAKQRLISFLNSLLENEPFSICVKDLSYLNTDTLNTLGDRLIFDIRCKCSKKVKGVWVDYNIDVEMQKGSQDVYFSRITNYSSRLLDISQKQTSKSRQKVIVISILNCILNNCDNDVAFLVGPFKKTLYGVDETVNTYTLVDDTILHLGVQLPLFMNKISTNTGGIYSNKWLPFLGSRLLAEKNGSIKHGRYESDYASKVESRELKSAVNLMQNYAKNATPEQEEMILRADMAVNLLAEKDEALAEKDRKLLKNTLLQDIRKYNEATKPKPVLERKKYQFARNLKGIKIEDLKKMLSGKQLNSVKAINYFQEMECQNEAFEGGKADGIQYDDKSMEEEDL